MCGFAAEVAAVLAERAIFDLRGPVIRVTGYDVPYPYWQIEDAYMPSVERVRRRGAPRARRRSGAPRDPARAPNAPRALLARSGAGPHGRVRRLDRLLVLNAGWRDCRARALRAERDGELDAGHALIGPVEVRGARAGQTLEVADRRGADRGRRSHARGRFQHAAQRAARRRGRRDGHACSGRSTRTRRPGVTESGPK